jgi:hypothetical protein
MRCTPQKPPLGHAASLSKPHSWWSPPRIDRATTRASHGSWWPAIRSAGSPGSGSGRPGPRLAGRAPRSWRVDSAGLLPGSSGCADRVPACQRTEALEATQEPMRRRLTSRSWSALRAPLPLCHRLGAETRITARGTGFGKHLRTAARNPPLGATNPQR